MDDHTDNRNTRHRNKDYTKAHRDNSLDPNNCSRNSNSNFQNQQTNSKVCNNRVSSKDCIKNYGISLH